MIKHIVLVRFAKDVTVEDIENIFQKIGALVTVLPTMQSFDYGKYNGSIERHKGFDYAFYMEFNNAKERDEYLIHPEHVKVGAELRALLDQEGTDSFMAFDYDTNLI
ncbi:Dabb family protein [Wohlfahrtiimonas larvae]|uniref:Stress-response A/B barrel domain-containing protein n=1 Tax=Wohlfahrtiimonas larvae TaxID=1157986 RepID=A0ABP9MG00_9GAMM|nr:Dabb family protein [Wohlfahrtiimonas larvae]